MIENDTVVAITIDQSKVITKTFISLEYYTSISDSLQKKIDVQEDIIKNDSIIEFNLLNQIESYKDVVENKKEVISKSNDLLEEQGKEIKKLQRKNNFKRILLGVSVGVNAALVLILGLGNV